MIFSVKKPLFIGVFKGCTQVFLKLVFQRQVFRRPPLLKSETLKILVLSQMISPNKFLDEMEKKEREKGNKGRKKKSASRTENDDISDDDDNEIQVEVKSNE